MRRVIYLALGLAVVAPLLPMGATSRADRAVATDALVGRVGVGAPFRIAQSQAALSSSGSGMFSNIDTGFGAAEPTLSVLKDGSIVAQSWTDTIRSDDFGDTWEVVHASPT